MIRYCDERRLGMCVDETSMRGFEMAFGSVEFLQPFCLNAYDKDIAMQSVC